MLLANVIRWTAGSTIPLAVSGPGLIDCHLYEQRGRMVLHLVNLTSAATWQAPLNQLIRVGPFEVKVRLPQPRAQAAARLLVSGVERPVVMEGATGPIQIDSILDHELLVIG